MALSFLGIHSWLRRRAARRPRAPEGEDPVEPSPAAAKVERGKRANAPTDAIEKPAARRSVRTYAREAAALLLLASALYAALALGSFEAYPARAGAHGPDWVGPVGAVFAGALVQVLGVVAWLVPLELGLVARPLLLDRRLNVSVVRVSGDVVFAVTAAALVHIAFPGELAFGAMPLGGVIGQLFGEILCGLFSEVGSYLVGATIVALILLQRATFSFIDVVQRVEAWLGGLRGRFDQGLGTVAAAWARAREVERQRREERRRAAEPLIATAEQADAIIAAFADDGEVGLGAELATVVPGAAVGGVATGSAGAPSRPGAALRFDPSGLARVKLKVDPLGQGSRPPPGRASTSGQARTGGGAGPGDGPVGSADVLERDRTSPPALCPDEEETPSPSPRLGKARPPCAPADSNQAAAPPTGRPRTQSLDEMVQQAATPPPSAAGGASEALSDGPGKGRAGRPGRTKKRASGPRIVDTSAAARTDRSRRRRGNSAARSRFKLPSTDLLEPARDADVQVDHEALRETARLLEKTLLDYGVQGEVKEIHPGPTVTTFEVAPAPGTKVSKVAGLADDLALGLSRKVRIIAPIPGKNRVGFEVPNDRRVAVNLRELVEDRRFLEMSAPLPCVLGRDIIGAPVYADLSSMPHVIVAGATGAGKSVGLNVMLVSLLYRRTPDELRLLLIDPKVVELAPFDRIPHLLLPVVTDMKQAANALKWAVDEMERRYQLFANAGTRNIKSYNGWVKRVQAGKAEPPAGPAKVSAIAPDGTAVEVPAAKDGSDAVLPDTLPYIVVVVEEFADLMMQQGKDVEASVARLAQKARAAGMHVILATQRPSVDVITGLIKANFPTRVAYRVAQKVDSRTILDDQGAEHLLGRGDMLVRLNGTNDSKRVQCPFCSESEVQHVTDMLRLQGEPDYDETIVQARDDGEEAADPGDAESDPLYDQAVRIVAETRRCSTSWIQRKLGIGYNRAAKIVETMERQRIIGPPNGSKDREIFVSPQ